MGTPGGAEVADSIVLLVPVHNTNLRASQRVESQGAQRLWEMQVRARPSLEPHAPELGAWGQGGREGFGVSKVPFPLLTPFPPLCAAACLPWGIGQQPPEASEYTENLSAGFNTRARQEGQKYCLSLPQSRVHSRRAGLGSRRVEGLGSVVNVLGSL